MTAPDDPAPSQPEDPMDAQFGPHRFYSGEGGGSTQFRGGGSTSRTCAGPGSPTAT